MLTSLQIQNFALIEDVCIDFTPGFNVFTGETGAGKSILIDAFGVALGDRASLDYLRQGTDHYWVQAVFDLADQKKVGAILEELDIPVDEETLFIRRKVLSSGKSQAFVNDRQVPVSVLTRLGEALVDIHGQHENQALLKPETPLTMIDVYGGAECSALFKAYKEAYAAHKEIAERLRALLEKSGRQDEEKERLARDLQEITEAQVTLGEDEELKERIQKLSNYEKIMEGVSAGHELLNGDDNTTGILDNLTEVKQNLSKASTYDNSLEELTRAVDSAWITLEDARQTLSSYLSNSDFDQEALNTLQERMDLLFHLKRKYGGSLETVLAQGEKLQTEYDALADLDGTIKALKKEEGASLADLHSKAAALTACRSKYGEAFSRQVTRHMQDLAMEQGKLVVELTPLDIYQPTGKDNVDFLFTANVGMEPKPLNRIASGGELSRLALAIKTVLLEKFGAATMVFDEIDSGVGGVTAQKMAEKIAIISQKRQVICVTHLAQIACFADNHLYIKKIVKNNNTFTLVEPLGQKERVEEIMRMIGGTNFTAAAQKNAKELLAMADTAKKNLHRKL